MLPDGANKEQVLALAEALYFGRDLINTPANDLGPAELESAARELANAFGAQRQGDGRLRPALRQFPDDPRRGAGERPQPRG